MFQTHRARVGGYTPLFAQTLGEVAVEGGGHAASCLHSAFPPKSLSSSARGLSSDDEQQRHMPPAANATIDRQPHFRGKTGCCNFYWRLRHVTHTLRGAGVRIREIERTLGKNTTTRGMCGSCTWRSTHGSENTARIVVTLSSSKLHRNTTIRRPDGIPTISTD